MTTVTVTTTETRPTDSVVWYRTPTDFINYIQKYNDIRHRTVFGWTTSPDMLSRTFVVTYSSQADYDIFLNDALAVEELARTTAYNTANNIIRSKTIS